MSEKPRIESLKKRADFLRLSEGSKRFATPVFLILSKPVLVPEHSTAIRVGYTVTKKIGNAVVRNRIKRRFRMAVAEVFPEYASAGHDYVIIARTKAVDINFAELRESLRFALSHLHKTRTKTL